MPATSAVWAVALIVVLAVVTLLVLLGTQRPEHGWGGWLREHLGGGRGHGAGVIAEHRDAYDGDTVALEDLLADGDDAPAYVAVPERFEARFDELAEQLSGQLADARAARGRGEQQR